MDSVSGSCTFTFRKIGGKSIKNGNGLAYNERLCVCTFVCVCVSVTTCGSNGKRIFGIVISRTHCVSIYIPIRGNTHQKMLCFRWIEQIQRYELFIYLSFISFIHSRSPTHRDTFVLEFPFVRFNYSTATYIVCLQKENVSIERWNTIKRR